MLHIKETGAVLFDASRGGHGSRRRLVAATSGGRDRQSARVSGQDL